MGGCKLFFYVFEYVPAYLGPEIYRSTLDTMQKDIFFFPISQGFIWCLKDLWKNSSSLKTSKEDTNHCSTVMLRSIRKHLQFISCTPSWKHQLFHIMSERLKEMVLYVAFLPPWLSNIKILIFARYQKRESRKLRREFKRITGSWHASCLQSKF